MANDATLVRDGLGATSGYQRPTADAGRIVGSLLVELHGPDGALKYREELTNLITQVGDQYYMDRGAGIGGPPAVVTGMQLGTGTTTPAKTGAGAAIVTLVTASLVAIGTPSSALNGSARRITYSATWAAGTATANGIAEVALVNQSTGTQTVAPASATISRALLSPTVNKGAGDSLTVSWTHDFTGS